MSHTDIIPQTRPPVKKIPTFIPWVKNGKTQYLQGFAPLFQNFFYTSDHPKNQWVNLIY